MSITLALVAHDRMKPALAEWAARHAGELAPHRLICTATTGGVLHERNPGLAIRTVKSGPLGGDLQIGARLSTGGVDAVIFLRDPMTPQPHEPDINALVRACDVHDVPCATNMAGARLLLKAFSAE